MTNITTKEDYEIFSNALGELSDELNNTYTDWTKSKIKGGTVAQYLEVREFALGFTELKLRALPFDFLCIGQLPPYDRIEDNVVVYNEIIKSLMYLHGALEMIKHIRLHNGLYKELSKEVGDHLEKSLNHLNQARDTSLKYSLECKE